MHPRSKLAIHTQHSEAVWIFVTLQPLIEWSSSAALLFSVQVTVLRDVIDRQTTKVCLSATNTNSTTVSIKRLLFVRARVLAALRIHCC
jgi:hypothetical protein